MQIGELSSIAQALLTWLISRWEFVASGFGVIGLVIWACARTGSTHVLNKRLWRLVLGKQELRSPVLSEFLAERDDLMHIRSMTGLKRVPTAAAAERLVAWLKKFDVDVDLVAAAGYHFDLDVPGFTRRPPGVKVTIPLMVGAIAVIYVGVAVAAVGISAPPFFQVKASKVWYVVTDQNARHFQWQGASAPAVESSNCDDKPAIVRATGYPDHDVQVMCELLTTEGGKNAWHEARVGQFTLAVFAATALLLAGTLLYRFIWRIGKANELYKLVERRKENCLEKNVGGAVSPIATEPRGEGADYAGNS